MSAEEVLRLRESNNELINENQKLLQMMDILEKFRAMFISMVNNCKCNTESMIRSKFNLLMEEYYDIKDNKGFINNDINNYNNNNNNMSFKTRNNLSKFGKSGVKKVYSFQNDQQINDNNKSNDNLVENSLGTDPDLNQREDNFNSEENNWIKEKNANQLNSNEDIRNNSLDRSQESLKSSTFSTKIKVEKKTNITERTTGLKKIAVKKKRPKQIRTRRFPCLWPGCDSIFKAKVDLRSHMSRHTGEKPLTCDWPACDFRTAFHRLLRIHKLKHTGEKPFKCSWPSCEWMFRSSDNLKRHMLRHTGEKRFLCEFDGCDRRYSSRYAMKYHLERAHKT